MMIGSLAFLRFLRNSIAISAPPIRLGIIAFFALILLNSRSFAFQNAPDSLIRYLDYIDSIKTLEMDLATTNFIDGQPPMVVFAGHIAYFAETGNRYFRSDPLRDPRGEYVEVLQKGFKYRFNVEAKMGVVSRQIHFWPLTPLQMMGLHISHCLGDPTPTNLHDLVNTKKFPGEVQPFGRNGFVIVAPYKFKNPSESDCGDIFVETAPEHQFAPKKIWIANRHPHDPVTEETPK
jgi:hypothetical protein